MFRSLSDTKLRLSGETDGGAAVVYVHSQVNSRTGRD